MIGNLISVSPPLMASAQRRHRACARLLHAVANVTLALPDFQHQSNKVTAEARESPLTPAGTTCAWYDGGRYPPTRSVFHCADASLSSASSYPSGGGDKTDALLAMVTVPGMPNLRSEMPTKHSHMVFAAFSNSSLFPSTSVVGSLDYSPVSDAIVVGATFGGHTSFVGPTDMSRPVLVAIRTRKPMDSRAVQPVWWDAAAEGGLGAWRAGPCSLRQDILGASFVTFSCNRLGYYSFRLLKAALRPPNLATPRFR